MQITRKVRHPYQVMEAAEMIIGERYAFVNKGPGSSGIFKFVMGGEFADSVAAARAFGHDLNASASTAPAIESPAEFDRRMKAKRDAAMAKALGF